MNTFFADIASISLIPVPAISFGHDPEPFGAFALSLKHNGFQTAPEGLYGAEQGAHTLAMIL
jgi:hypothetical protein